MKILLIEDDGMLCEILQKVLENEGYAVDITSDGEEGLYLAEQFTPDAIVLDVMLPTLDGLSLLQRLRERGMKTPVLLLTAKSSIENRIKGLDLGADDYLPKPFDHGELLARLRAIIRRHHGTAHATKYIKDLEIDLSGHVVRRAGKLISLTSKEFHLLEYLALREGEVVSRGELLEHLYPISFESDSNLIDVYITYLRNKIDKPFSTKLIQTVRGEGYRLKGSETE